MHSYGQGVLVLSTLPSLLLYLGGVLGTWLVAERLVFVHLRWAFIRSYAPVALE